VANSQFSIRADGFARRKSAAAGAGRAREACARHGVAVEMICNSSDLESGAARMRYIVFATRAALRRACLRVAFSSRARSALSDRAHPRPLLVGDLRSPRANRMCPIRISGPVPSRASSEDRAAPPSRSIGCTHE